MTHKFIQKGMTWILESKKIAPIILTVPHDNLSFQEIPDMFISRAGRGVIGRDKYVWYIAKDIACGTENISLVRGLCPRALVDYNRSPDGTMYTSPDIEPAYIDPKLESIYMSYHANVERLVLLAIEKYGVGNCLLVDMHGFTHQPRYGEYDVILGTGNRKSIYQGDIDKQLAAFLESLGYSVFLPAEVSIDGEEVYNAEFTTRHYAERFHMNAIQIEIAKKFRTKEGKNIGQILANNLKNFLASYFNM